jgi:hypothetical protein
MFHNLRIFNYFDQKEDFFVLFMEAPSGQDATSVCAKAQQLAFCESSNCEPSP